MGLPLRSPVAVVRGRDRGKRKEAELYAADPVTGKANFSPGVTTDTIATECRSMRGRESLLVQKFKGS